jgi:hypothetical protein
MPVQPGEQVRVTITNQGAPGYLVDITAAGQTAFNTSPDTNASPCVTGAFEQSDFPTYDHLTQTTPVAFHASRVWWAQEGQPTATETKLLSTRPPTPSCTGTTWSTPAARSSRPPPRPPTATRTSPSPTSNPAPPRSDH